MGYRIIFLVLALMVIFGSIVIALGQKQVDARIDLSETVSQKQTQQLANNTVLEGISILKEHLGSQPALQSYSDKQVNGSTVSLQIHDYIYRDKDNLPRLLPLGTYLLISEALTVVSAEERYRARTEAMYTYWTSANPPLFDVGNYITWDNNARYFIIFEPDDILIYTASQYFSISSTMNYSNDHVNREVLKIPKETLKTYNNTILFSHNLNWFVTVGNAAQYNTSAEQALYQGTDYKVNLILNTGSPTRIGSHIYSSDPDRIVIQSTSNITTNHIPPIDSNAHFYSNGTIAAGPYYPNPTNNDTIALGERSQVPINSYASMNPNVPLPIGEIPDNLSALKATVKSWAEPNVVPE